ncbi:uncharacterized protein KY384_007062 [Bacidia gigantensis]|uniref:uncharacterized protein n=1 Tax=Bacidia gigantensis TaxID=2732470 RepID=UPI001D0575AB|nr:uncharacterized protein KY384_007062 [Bacidia gigantensis]KAG8528146.1 hypothetical protein KY384_007062 [Bacidia gigantensis]
MSLQQLRFMSHFERKDLFTDPVPFSPVCPGYSEGLDLVLRDQNNTAKAAVARRQNARSKFQSPTLPQRPDAFVQELCVSQESLSIDFFTSSFPDPTADEQSQRGFVDLIPFLYHRVALDSPLALCVAAISHLIFNKWVRNAQNPETFQAKKAYGKALASTRLALQDPISMVTDDTLMTVCLLGFYEACFESFRARISSPCHYEGAGALISQRRGQSMTKTTGTLLMGIRSNIAYRAALTGSVVDFHSPVWQDLDEVPLNVASLLDVMIAEVANFQASMRQAIASASKLGEDDQIRLEDPQISLQASEMHSRLISWIETVPADWTPISVPHFQIPESVTQAGLYGTNCDIYKDIIVCSTWNDWRVARLKVLVVLARCCTGHKRAEMVEAIQELADAICASIPFCLGSRTLPAPMHAQNIQYPSEPGKLIPKPHYKTAAAYGGWYLFVPMKQVIAVGNYLRDGQSMWVALQLRRLAEIYNVVPMS